MPPSIPTDELYFWSPQWQALEAEHDRERSEGNAIVAESMTDVIRDLMSADD